MAPWWPLGVDRVTLAAAIQVRVRVRVRVASSRLLRGLPDGVLRSLGRVHLLRGLGRLLLLG